MSTSIWFEETSKRRKSPAGEASGARVPRARLLVAACLSIALARPAAAQAYLYRVHDLGTLGGGRSFASDLNEAGQVVGFARNTSEKNRPFLVTPSGGEWFLDANLDGANDLMQDLGVLDPSNPPALFGVAWGMNELAQVVGTCQNAALNSRAFLWDLGVIVDLGDLGRNSPHTAHAVNDLGEVVGGSYVDSQSFHGFYWTAGGGIQDLGTLPGGNRSSAVDINNTGQIAGQVYAPGNASSEAALWQSPSGPIVQLGTLGGTTGAALAINEAQRIAGTAADAAGVWHPFLLTPVGGVFFQDADLDGINDLMQDLGLLDPADIRAAANDVNASGHAVGYSSTTALPDLGGARAFFFDGSSLFDLNTCILPGSGFVLRQAYAINDAGQIVGSGHVGGVEHAFLLDPTPFSMSQQASSPYGAPPGPPIRW